MPDTGERSPVDQLVDLFVYAPVGLLLEYQDVLPRLIKRGKSQVQITRLVGTMAAKKGQREVNARLGDVVDAATSTVAQGITDVGARVGLAPEPIPEPGDVPATPTAVPVPADDRPLPIAGYNDLTAKQIVVLLPDLTAKQRDQLRGYESTHKRRTTVLARIDALATRAG